MDDLNSTRDLLLVLDRLHALEARIMQLESKDGLLSKCVLDVVAKLAAVHYFARGSNKELRSELDELQSTVSSLATTLNRFIK